MPAFDETRPLNLVWQGLDSNSGDLIILLGNWPETAPLSAQAVTRASLDRLRQSTTQLPFELITPLESNAPTLLLLGPIALPATQGVGLARRILMDVAVGLWRAKLLSNPWIGTTDADAILPKNYWHALTSPASVGLKIFAYKHLAQSQTENPLEKALEHAHTLYEHYLRQYQTALAQAMPEFGFATLGSLYGIHALAYEQVRGYPALAAGEDFYLLNKIAKVATITQLPDVIGLVMRASNRTPYGTGPSVAQLMAAPAMEHEPWFYNPRVLSTWIEALQSLRGPTEAWSSVIPAKLRQKLTAQYQQCRTDTQRHKALICLLDGLRCQQLLRKLHEHEPKLSWQALITGSYSTGY